MCTVLLPPGDNPIAVNEYINIYQLHNKSTTSTWKHFDKHTRQPFIELCL